MKTYWLTLAIDAQELADHMDCTVEEVEAQDYIGAIRDFGETVKVELIDEDGK